MYRQNYRDVIQKNHQDDIDKVKLLCESARMGISRVPDAYFGYDERLQNVFDLVKNTCYRILEE